MEPPQPCHTKINSKYKSGPSGYGHRKTAVAHLPSNYCAETGVSDRRMVFCSLLLTRERSKQPMGIECLHFSSCNGHKVSIFALQIKWIMEAVYVFNIYDVSTTIKHWLRANNYKKSPPLTAANALFNIFVFTFFNFVQKVTVIMMTVDVATNKKNIRRKKEEENKRAINKSSSLSDKS